MRQVLLAKESHGTKLRYDKHEYRREDAWAYSVTN